MIDNEYSDSYTAFRRVLSHGGIFKWTASLRSFQATSHIWLLHSSWYWE